MKLEYILCILMIIYFVRHDDMSLKLNYITLYFSKYYANKSSMLFSPNTFSSPRAKVSVVTCNDDDNGSCW